MEIEIQAQDFSPSPSALDFVKRRLSFALGRVGDDLHRVTVRLSEVDDARGGVDKSCLVQVRLRNLPDVVVENRESNLRVAIHRAADRAGWTVSRRLQRQRNYNRLRFHTGKPATGARRPTNIQ